MKRGQAAGAGYSVLELMAAVATMGIILALLFSTTGLASLAWRENAAASDTFQQARSAFATVTQRLGRATLNGYRDYYDPEAWPIGSPIMNPDKVEYRFYSELHFISGPVTELIPAEVMPGERSTHAVFFQAPLGLTPSRNPSSRGLLNVCGYYLEQSVDPATSRDRARLYETLPTAETFDLYRYGWGSAWLGKFAEGQLKVTSRSIAENIVALILLPQRFPEDTAIAPRYRYDSRRWQTEKSDLAEQTQNQLPPLMQVTMVIVDELSVKKWEGTPHDAAHLVQSEWFQEAQRYADDLKQLQEKMTPRYRYRIFQESVPLASSTWSETAN